MIDEQYERMMSDRRAQMSKAVLASRGDTESRAQKVARVGQAVGEIFYHSTKDWGRVSSTYEKSFQRRKRKS